MIKNTTALTAKDVTDYQKTVTRKSTWIVLISCIVIVVCGAVQIALKDISFGVFCVVFGVVFYPLLLLMNRALNKKYLNSLSASKMMVNSYEFDNDQFVVSTLDGDKVIGTSTLTYDRLYKACEYDNAYYLFISSRQSFIVLKNSFTEGSPADLSVLLSAKLGKKYHIKLSKKALQQGKTMVLAENEGDQKK